MVECSTFSILKLIVMFLTISELLTTAISLDPEYSLLLGISLDKFSLKDWKS